MSTSTYSRGQVVYGNGSYAPNRGQVSAQGAQGYLQRELTKNHQGPYGGTSQFGSDGQSDTRSGVAAQSLARTTSQPSNQTARPTNNVMGFPTPTVTIGSNGQLKLPYNANFSQAVLQGLQGMNQDLLGLQMEGQQQALQHGQSKRQLGLDYNQLRRATLNNNAARGTAFSSGYGLDVANNATSFNNASNDLEQQNSAFNQNIGLRRSAIVTAFNDMLRQQALQMGNELTDEAGDLGYGTSPVNTQKSNTSKTTKSPSFYKSRNNDRDRRNRKRRRKGRN